MTAAAPAPVLIHIVIVTLPAAGIGKDAHTGVLVSSRVLCLPASHYRPARRRLRWPTPPRPCWSPIWPRSKVVGMTRRAPAQWHRSCSLETETTDTPPDNAQHRDFQTASVQGWAAGVGRCDRAVATHEYWI